MPCLLLQGGSLVKTIKFKSPNYIGDVINTVRIFNQMEVDELILLDIAATPERREPSFELIKTIANECFMPFAYGGGIRNREDIERILRIGTEKVIINNYAFKRPEFIRESSNLFGRQCIVVSIDAKKNFSGEYEVYTQNGRQSTGINPIKLAIQMEEMGAGEILVTSIDRDGTWQGYDIELTKMVSEAVNIPVIACGGAGVLKDFANAVKYGKASAVAAGSMFVYQGIDLGVLINFPAHDELQKVLEDSHHIF